MITFGCTYLGATFLSLAITPLVGRLARAKKLVDRPGARKMHSGAVPRIGGVAIIAAMLALTIAVMVVDSSVGRAVRSIQAKIVAMLIGAGFIALVGLVDDIRGLRARFKLLAQVAAAAAVCAFDIRIKEVVVGRLFTLELGALSWPITIFWIVGITNAVNLIDGLDGLAAGISAAACGVIAVFALYTSQPVMAVLMLALLGSLTGFLYFNFNPARVFMGDCGTYFLGFVLATSSVICATKASTIVGLALPALALGVPIFDTLFSILRRFLERRSIFAPDRSHIHHRLIDMGLRQWHVVIFLYVVTLVAAGLGMFMMTTRDLGVILVFACVALLIVLVFRIVGSVSLRATIAGVQHKLAIARQAKEHERGFENAKLLLREANSLDAWWQAVCAAAAGMDFVRLSLSLTNRDGTTRGLAWRCSGPELPPHQMLRIKVPLRDRRAGPPLEADVAAAVDGSLEAAGRRLAYFGRLLDEHSIADLPSGPRERPAIAQQAPWPTKREAPAPHRGRAGVPHP